MSERAWRGVLIALAIPHLALAVWAAADHASFVDSLAPFGPLNGHLVDDYAAASATFGVAILLASLRPVWRVPLLALTLVWTALHAASHVVASGSATRAGVGPAEASILVGSTLLLGLLLRGAARQAEAREITQSRRMEARRCSPR